jgi:monovalent cation/proton antiporter MnhG/PhaG subunit
MSPQHVIAVVLLWVGVGLILIACLGVVVARSAYDRLHFSSPAILGVAFVAASVLVQESFSLIGDKAVLIAVLMIVGSPLVTQAIGRAARLQEHGDWRPVPGEDVEVQER